MEFEFRIEGLEDLMKFMQAYKKFKNDLENGTVDKIFCDYVVPIVAEDSKKIFDWGVEQYYADYSPQIYSRKESLKKAYLINSSSNTVSWDVSADLIPNVHRVSSDYIYEYMFEQGWHGGADKGPNHPSPGTLWWRYPPVSFMGMKRYSIWGDPSVQTTPPTEYINSELESYDDSSSSVVGHGIKNVLDDGWEIIKNSYEFFSYF